ncbi:AAA-like domain-containing protein [Moorena sp. SIO3I6]|uniref:AAA-like domain-containing protein n=1 Tax=Moorena sp. SIO3I6 TaxID=2607831 RepID=UPI0025F67667|nr:AAA-like domain-containing protein [Moorena sp. SIO3I6]
MGYTKLTSLQEWILYQAWEEKTYAEMAEEIHYGSEYLRRIASKLWLLLSKIFHKPITKGNFKPVLASIPLNPLHQERIKKYYQSLSQSPTFPIGVVPLSSAFYIKRPPVEEMAYQAIEELGSLILIRSPKETGKTSLMLRIVDGAKSLGYRTVWINFAQAERTILSNLDRLLRWLCANVCNQLVLAKELDDYWDEDIGSKASCSSFFEGHILASLEQPLVLVMDEVNLLLEHKQTALDFFILLRSWSEAAKYMTPWQKLRLVLAYSTEVDIPVKTFDYLSKLGLPIELPQFNPQQIQQLAQLYGLDWFRGQASEKLMAMVGGHPKLVQLALYHLACQNLSLEKLLEQAPTREGIYRDHLLLKLTRLRQNAELATFFNKVIQTDRGVELDSILINRLKNLGLITFDENHVMPSCDLYRQYFLAQLNEK